MGESERDVPNVHCILHCILHCVLHCILHCILQCALCTARPVTRSKSQDPCLMARSLVICNRSRCFYERCKGPERQRCNKSLTPKNPKNVLFDINNKGTKNKQTTLHPISPKKMVGNPSCVSRTRWVVCAPCRRD